MTATPTLLRLRLALGKAVRALEDATEAMQEAEELADRMDNGEERE